MTYDGSSRAEGLQIFLSGQPAECEVVRDHLDKNITGGGGDNITIGERFRDRGFKNGLVDEFQVFNRQLTALEISQLQDGNSLSAAIQNPTGQQREKLYDVLSLHRRCDEFKPNARNCGNFASSTRSSKRVCKKSW